MTNNPERHLRIGLDLPKIKQLLYMDLILLQSSRQTHHLQDYLNQNDLIYEEFTLQPAAVMLATLCWWLFQCEKSVTNISNLSPTEIISNIRHQYLASYKDVDKKWMLVTLFWWLFLDFGDRMLVLMLKERGYRWPRRPKPSPTSQSCHQHVWSPTSVTNICRQHQCSLFSPTDSETF